MMFYTILIYMTRLQFYRIKRGHVYTSCVIFVSPLVYANNDEEGLPPKLLFRYTLVVVIEVNNNDYENK